MNRPKTDAERRERTLESKRRWARKNRAILKAKQKGIPFDEAAFDQANMAETEDSMASCSPVLGSLQRPPVLDAVDSHLHSAQQHHHGYEGSSVASLAEPEYAMCYAPDSRSETFREAQLEPRAKLGGPSPSRHPLQGKDPNSRSTYFFSQEFSIPPASLSRQGTHPGSGAPARSTTDPFLKPLPPATSRSREHVYPALQEAGTHSPSPSPGPSSKWSRSFSSVVPRPPRMHGSPSSSLAPPLSRPRSQSPVYAPILKRSRSPSPSCVFSSKRPQSPPLSRESVSKRRSSYGRNRPEEAALQLLALKTGASSPPTREPESDLSLSSSPGRYEFDVKQEDEELEQDQDSEGEEGGEGEESGEGEDDDEGSLPTGDGGVVAPSSPPDWSPSKSERDRGHSPVQTPPRRPPCGWSKGTIVSPDLPPLPAFLKRASTSLSASTATLATPHPRPRHIFRSGPRSSPAGANFVFSSPAHPDMSKSLGLVPQEPSASFLGEFGTPHSGLARDVFAGEGDA
jgi:hypothetical protein